MNALPINYETLSENIVAAITFVTGSFFFCTKVILPTYSNFIKPMVSTVSYLREMMAKIDHIINEVVPNIDLIKKEVLPNGGSSLRDVVNRIETRQVVMDSRFAAYTLDSSSGYFETNEQGEVVNWNNTFRDLLGVTPRIFNWMSVVLDSEKSSVVSSWKLAVEQKREFYSRINFQKANGEIINCSVKAYPMRDGLSIVRGWFGVVTKVTNA